MTDESDELIRQTVEHMRELASRIESRASRIVDVTIRYGTKQVEDGFMMRAVHDGSRTLSVTVVEDEP